MHRRHVLAGMGLVPVAALAACAPNANSGSTASDSATATSLIAAYSEGGTTLNPFEANDVTSDTFVVAAYDQLVTYATTAEEGRTVAKTEEIVPMLASAWTADDASTTYTFTLRDDVTFASGNPLTADDVVGSFALIRDSSSASFLYQMAGIDEVAKTDDHTVTITLNGPNHLFLQILPQYSFSIVDVATVTENGGAEWLAQNTAGSGPYAVESWDPSTSATITARPDYWGTAPAVTSVSVKFISESSNRMQLLERGEAQLITEIPAKDVESLSSAEGVTIDSRKSNKILFFAMNNEVAPFDDPRVRQAVCYAIPYEKLIDDVMLGQATEMRSSVASSTPGWTDAGFDYSYDLDKAKALLKEAGHADGFSFDFTLGSGFQDWNDDAVLIQASLKELGITMNIKNMARAQFLEALDTKKLQAYISRWTSFVNDPGYHLGLLLASDGSSNYMNYTDPDVDDLLESAAAETDQATRDELYGKAQELITQDAPWAYLYEYNIVIGLGAAVQGYTSYPDGIVRFAQLSLGA